MNRFSTTIRLGSFDVIVKADSFSELTAYTSFALEMPKVCGLCQHEHPYLKHRIGKNQTGETYPVLLMLCPKCGGSLLLSYNRDGQPYVMPGRNWEMYQGERATAPAPVVRKTFKNPADLSEHLASGGAFDKNPTVDFMPVDSDL